MGPLFAPPPSRAHRLGGPSSRLRRGWPHTSESSHAPRRLRRPPAPLTRVLGWTGLRETPA